MLSTAYHLISVPSPVPPAYTMRTNAPHLQRLPLELRNKIYCYIVDDITLPATRDVSALSHVRARIPACLRLTDRIIDEAAKALLHRALLTVEEIKIPGPANLLSDVPPDMLLKNVRRLEVTKAQKRYGQQSSLLPAYFLHDLVTRCPQLRSLTLPITSDILFTSSSRLKTSAELAATTGLHLVFEHATLSQLNLTCADSSDYRNFQPLEAWLLAEAKRRGRWVELDINITPHVRYVKHPECVRGGVGCITWVQWFDFFG